jgi:hypothetical protein
MGSFGRLRAIRVLPGWSLRLLASKVKVALSSWWGESIWGLLAAARIGQLSPYLQLKQSDAYLMRSRLVRRFSFDFPLQHVEPELINKK